MRLHNLQVTYLLAIGLSIYTSTTLVYGHFGLLTKLKDAIVKHSHNNASHSGQPDVSNKTISNNTDTYAQRQDLEIDNNKYISNEQDLKSNEPSLYNNKKEFGSSNGAYPDGDKRIPFWNIAHMINSIEQIEPTLGNGSNGIEVDISFDKRGVPVESYHGFPCDCGRHCHYRQDFIELIDYIAKISVPPASSNLQLVLLDLKLKDLNETQKIVAGESLAKILHQHLYEKYAMASGHNHNYIGDRSLSKPPLRVVISINYVQDRVLIRAFFKYVEQNRLDSMRKLVGFDVGMNDELLNISSMWDEFDRKTTNIWQGDGLTNCANLVRGTDRLREAVAMRNNQGHFRKIYFWTVDVLYQARSILRMGVDAVLTNQPQRIKQVIEEEDEFKSRYRLATPWDDPFAQYWIQPTASKMSIPSPEDAKETLSNIRNTTINFVKTLPDGFKAAVGKVIASAKATRRRSIDKDQ